MKEYVIALDQGTSSSRAIVFNKRGEAMAVRQKEFTQHFPKPGMVEHDPMEIWATEYAMMTEAVTSLGLGGSGHRRHRNHQPARDHYRVGRRDRKTCL